MTMTMTMTVMLSTISRRSGIRSWVGCIHRRLKHDLGIVGLPNVGKSTLFNVLVQAQQAEAANYPFCTIKPNTARVAINDKRLDTLAQVAKSAKTVYSQLVFTDIAGLIKGASDGVGLGNQFLGAIRQVSAIIHVVRCFTDDNIVHVHTGDAGGALNDIHVVDTELCLSDLALLTSLCKKLQRSHDTSAARMKIQLLERCIELLNDGMFLTSHEWTHDEWAYLTQLDLLSTKPVMYACNVDDDDVDDANDMCKQVYEHAKQRQQFVNDKLLSSTPCISICASVEEDILALEPHERHEFEPSSGTGLVKVVNEVNTLLNNHVFYTVGPQEAHAWSIERSTRAVDAAAKIHSDIADGFIKAEVIKPHRYVEYDGDEARLKKDGLIAIEGRDYIVCDGDIIHFRFKARISS